MSEDKQDQESVFDTDQQYLGNVYAKALLGVVDKPNSGLQVEEVLDELNSFSSVLDSLPRLKSVLESSRVSFRDKEEMVAKALGGKASPAFVNFVKVVCRKGRADCFSAISRAARSIHDERSGSVQATMTTAVPVDDGVRQKVAEKLSGVLGKKVSLDVAVDSSIIGGLVVRVGDTVYDGSVTNQLGQVRKSAIGRANQQIKESLDRFTMVESG